MPPHNLEGAEVATQMTLPLQSAVQVEGDQLPGREPGIHALAVRHRTRVRQVALLMDLGQLAFRIDLVLPH